MTESQLCCAICDSATESFELRPDLGPGVKVCPECAEMVDGSSATSIEHARELASGVQTDLEELVASTSEEELVARYAVLSLREQDGAEDDGDLSMVRGLLSEVVVQRLARGDELPALYRSWLQDDVVLLNEVCTLAGAEDVPVPSAIAAPFEVEKKRLRAQMDALLSEGLDESSACAVLCALEEVRAGRRASVSECALDARLQRVVEQYAAREDLAATFEE